MNVFLIIYLNVIIWAPLLHYFAPVKIMGFSVFNTVLPTIGMFGMFMIMLSRFTRSELEITLSLVTFFLFFYFMQKYMGITRDNLLKYYVNNRFIFNIYFIILIFNHLDLMPYRRWYLFSLLFSFAFANVTSVLYMLGLPTFRIYDESLSIYEIGRFGGIWGAPNGFAYLMALVCFAMICLWRMSWPVKLALYLLGVAGWVMAGSRMCALFYIVMFPFIFMDIHRTRGSIAKYIVIMLAGGIILLTALMATDLGNYLLNLGGAFNRLAEQQAGEDIRVQKNSYFFNKLLESGQNFFFGIPREEQISNVVQFSDNGILLFMLNLGIPFFVVYCLMLLRIVFSKVVFYLYKYLAFWVLMLIIGITFGVNNATIWDNYIFVCILILYLLAGFIKENKQADPDPALS